jgi:capsular exopolysaccharide synthesis family protein
MMSLIERALEKGKTQPAEQVNVPASQFVAVERGRRSGDALHERLRLAPREVAMPDIADAMGAVQRGGFLAPKDKRLQQRAEYRHIKRKLLSELKGKTDSRSRIMLVTSAFSGEGKSFSALNLALSLASELDYSTLLIDGDVIKPNLSNVFGVAGRKGLMDVIVDSRVDPESAVLSTSIPGLFVLPAGAPNPDATEHLASIRGREVIGALAAPMNRILLIDSLPMLQTTEARALASHAGQVILVVRADVTPTGAIKQAVEYLDEDCNVKMVLNAVDPMAMVGTYGYANYYGSESAEKA